MGHSSRCRHSVHRPSNRWNGACCQRGGSLDKRDGGAGWRMERRNHQRMCLRLRVMRLGSQALAAEGADHFDNMFWTENVSAGGVYVRMPQADTPNCGDTLHLELIVPEGEGYSTRPCRLKGTGTIVRRMPHQNGTVGLAIQFAQRLDLTFVSEDGGSES